MLQGEIILVQLEKDKNGLGITLGNGKEEGESFVFIKNVVKASIADVNGKLRIGDRLVSVSINSDSTHSPICNLQIWYDVSYHTYRCNILKFCKLALLT